MSKLQPMNPDEIVRNIRKHLEVYPDQASELVDELRSVVEDNTAGGSSNTSDDELREVILANLKHAYFNAKTDNVALSNGLIPNQNHALGILENKADDLMQLIKQRESQVALEARVAEIQYLNDEYQEDAQDWMRDHTGYTTAMIPMDSYIKRKKELEAQLTTTHKGGDDE
ncbi:hypothetical protein [Rhodococcus sp. B10]|uniref:hypothetical protein n=1 Tax=Rhodococcus sp. B10 TaxID=2695876 RepID=UPI001430D233|nr:hypothetical protein [Rhodococcus sp. B10]NIL77137.1 hypothetical protein [Rhodococcus sp. B10]